MDKKAFFINYCRMIEAASTGEWHTLFEAQATENSTATNSAYNFISSTIPNITKFRITGTLKARVGDGYGDESAYASCGKQLISLYYDALGAQSKTVTLNEEEIEVTADSTELWFIKAARGSTSYSKYKYNRTTGAFSYDRSYNSAPYNYGNNYASISITKIEAFYVEPKWHTLFEGSYVLSAINGTIPLTNEIPADVMSLSVKITWERYYLDGSVSTKTDNCYPKMLRMTTKNYFGESSSLSSEVLVLQRQRTGETTATITLKELTTKDIKYAISNNIAKGAVQIKKIEAAY